MQLPPVLTTLRFIANHPLSRGRRLGSLLDFVRWQIGSRLVPGPVLYEWVNGSHLVVRRGEAGLTGNVYCGLHEFADMAYVLHVTDASDLFVDVGANVGSYTILACAVRGARGYCFEPVPSTFERLMANVRVNRIEDRVRCLNLGIADRAGRLRFTRDRDVMNHVVESEVGDTVEVETARLDDLLANEQPSVVKIDVEGFEANVLEGARETLARPCLHSVIVELNGSSNRYGLDESQVIERLLQLRFGPHRYDPFSRKLVRIEGKNAESGNTLFVRGVERVQAKLSATPRVRVKGRDL